MDGENGYNGNQMGVAVVFANQKGGVGKTTTVANLGACVALEGRRVLMIDFDPQGNLSSSVGADRKRPNIYRILSGEATCEASIQATGIENLYIIPSNVELTGAGIELASREKREFFLKSILSDVKQDWDYLFIDCPPSLGLLTLNGLAAADRLIIPLQCEYFALEGLSMLLKTVEMVQEGINPDIVLTGLLFTMYDARTKLSHEVVKRVTGYFKDKVFRTVIPRNVRISEAPSHGKTVIEYDRTCIGALSYRNLAREVLARV